MPDWPSAPKERSFIEDDSLWVNIGSRQITVRFQVTYDGGRWTKTIGTTCPSSTTGPQGQTSSGIELTMPDKKGRNLKVTVDVEHLFPSRPSKMGQECVPLQGSHRSTLAKVLKIRKTPQTASLESVSGNGGERWEEELSNLCVVEKVVKS